MSEVISGIEGELRSNAVDVESIEWTDDAVDLVYLTAFPGASVNHQEMGRALRTFVNAAEHNEWEPTRVEATVLRHQEDVLGTWYAEAEWFRQYLDYDISGEEFSERVIGTLSEDSQ
ncbi:hypothetical protein [Halobellus ruber]|uniref:DUF8159 domain-containing protein n=1 Tax=Halobellus ruber TaxID=2761102 RepID=A0A7J9SF14_9EURY|nr:hypothetical protein [Halobellus ruber]MBB6645554.1 hypothetical protein [Halobellus ruber]